MTWMHELIWMRDPDSFGEKEILVTGHRIATTVTDGKLENIEPKVLGTSEFEAKLAKLGTIKHVDWYLEHTAGFHVVRGIVVHEGLEKYFQLVYDVLYEKMVDGMIGGLKYTRPVPAPVLTPPEEIEF